MKLENNYEIAKNLADLVDEEIINVLKSKESFCVEAGAGSGKTYSLLNVINWLEKNKNWSNRSIACITYTNVAVDEILKRISNTSPIIPSTIHTFAWDAIKGYKKELIGSLEELGILKNFSEEEIKTITNVNYTLGVRYVEDSVMYLHHDDVINLFAWCLDRPKFRQLLSHRYALILIDEYQDSAKILMDKFLKYFVNQKQGPQFGLFGDHWQTIYSLDSVCGEVKSGNLIEIKKKSNFRSQTVIVELLNKIRPDLPQVSAINENNGEIKVILTNKYRGIRNPKGYYKDDLPDAMLQSCIDNTLKILKTNGWMDTEEERTKVFMLTHKGLSKQQGYENLLSLVGDGLKNCTNPYVNLFDQYIEPIYSALNENNVKKLFEILGVRRQPLVTRNSKLNWKKFYLELKRSRDKTIYDVIKCVDDSKIIPLPESVLTEYNDYNSSEEKSKNDSIYQINYSEVVKALDFLNENSIYATNHGVKGAEYDNVLMVMGKGWNNYRFEKILYKDPERLSEKDYDAYIRNRNLFYVGCSRAKKRLALLITIPVQQEFVDYLQKIFGEDNIYEYSQLVGG